MVSDRVAYQLFGAGSRPEAGPGDTVYPPELLEEVESGRVLFENLRCITCHDAGSGQRGPDLAGRFGMPVGLQDGRTVLFDEDYVRESILEPKRRLSAGFEPLMPTYAGQVSEVQIQHLTAYIKSIGDVDVGGDE